MKYKCIIFDCDGVLVDSEKISIKTLVLMAASFGVVLEKENTYRLFLGKSLEFCFNHIESQSDKKLPGNFEQEFRIRSFEAFKSDLKPIEGIHDLLNQLKIPFCVASNGPADKIRLNLTTTKLINHFEGAIFSAYDIKSWKPDPDLYLHAAKTMGFEVQDCVVIEDSAVGVQAALSGGFAVFGFANKGNQTHLEQLDIPIFDTMTKLAKLLE
ncbi:HAD family hydrolase [Flavobacterium sp. W22_SRS_FP1]|uniref:HAD family hydrolase n=1 Tax=Flavobacterium sp. W22_SRS_FP1 TaxID=3240276 RepID=UPI003F90D5B5